MVKYFHGGVCCFPSVSFCDTLLVVVVVYSLKFLSLDGEFAAIQLIIRNAYQMFVIMLSSSLCFCKVEMYLMR